MLALHGWSDLGERLTRLARSVQWEAMARAVPDEVVHAFAAVGRYDEIVPRMRERFRGIGRLAFPVPRPDAREEERVREAGGAARERRALTVIGGPQQAAMRAENARAVLFRECADDARRCADACGPWSLACARPARAQRLDDTLHLCG
jgi:hypothetical protein